MNQEPLMNNLLPNLWACDINYASNRCSPHANTFLCFINSLKNTKYKLNMKKWIPVSSYYLSLEFNSRVYWSDLSYVHSKFGAIVPNMAQAAILVARNSPVTSPQNELPFLYNSLRIRNPLWITCPKGGDSRH